jgi:hypothetical protein
MTFIEGPRILYRKDGLNRPLDLSLSTEDIDGASSKKKCFRTNRCTDPLDPVYKLPTFVAPTVAQAVEFQGSIPTNYIGDIRGAAPRKLSPVRKTINNSLDVSDIPYAEPFHFRRRIRPLPSVPLTDSLDVNMINRGSSRKPEIRNTNPLEPEYIISTTDMRDVSSKSEPMLIGSIEKSKPIAPKQARIQNLTVLTGSTPQRFVGRLRHSSVGESNIATWNKPLPTASGSGSLKKGIITKRSTNPLDPNYALLDGHYDSACRLFMCFQRWDFLYSTSQLIPRLINF